mmetsp:Transcript_979/g.2152  ORF Transcript_979/g.2152 Transcript_979/m.2152 type:complete len:399 (+) Transcript_979:69-1265(+)
MAAAADANVDSEPGGDSHLSATKDFFSKFKSEQQSLEEDLFSVTADVPENKIHEVLDSLLTRVQALEDSFTRQAHLLPAYDMQQYKAALKELTNGISKRREQLAPRRKFQFKRKPGAEKDNAKSADVAAAAVAEGTGNSVSSATTIPIVGKVIEDLRQQLVLCKPGDLSGSDVTLRSLTNCRVLLLDRIGALHCHDLEGCEVVVGAVGSSTLLYTCNDCVLTIAMKQLRLHDSTNMLLHLHTLSGPVIENCRRICFAPFDLTYPELHEHLAAAALGTPSHSEASPWADVQDFNWHKRHSSPNWCVLAEAYRREGLSFTSTLDDVQAISEGPCGPEELARCDAAWKAQESSLVAGGQARNEGPSTKRAPPPEAPSPPPRAPSKPPKDVATDRLDSDDEF